MRKSGHGFTIVELLVVIVVIGILAAISIVSYAGITERAIAARIKSDLNTNTKLLELYKIEHDEYPRTIGTETNCPDSPIVDDKYCLKVSEDDDTLTYEGDGGTGGGVGDTYTVTITDEATAIAYEIVPGGTAVAVTPPVAGGTFMNTLGNSNDQDAASILQTADGGYMVAGHTYGEGAGIKDSLIAKYSSIGEVSWAKLWGGAQSDYVNSVIQTSDGGYAVAGYTLSFGGNAYIAKYDSTGGLTWDKTWGGGSGASANSIVQTSDNGFVITGNAYSFGAGGGDAFIAKFDSDGAFVWDTTWGGTGAEDSKSIAQASDGGFVISGTTGSYGTADEVFLVKFSSAGVFSWNRTWGGAGDDYVAAMVKTSDNGYAVTGYTDSFSAQSADIFVVKYDSSGTFSWNKKIGGTDWDEARSIAPTSDGGVVVVGYSESFLDGGSYEMTDGFILKLTSDGSSSWMKTWGDADFEYANAVTQTSDGGYAVTGQTDGFGEGGYEIFITKYESGGTIAGCASLLCENANPTSNTPSATMGNPSASSSSPAATIADISATVNPSSLITNPILQ